MTALFKKKKEENKEEQVEKTQPVVQAPSFPAGSVVKNPHVSERALSLTQKNQYVFLVEPYATKSEIRKELEKVHNIHIVKIRTVTQPRKVMLLRGKRGSKSRFKKAIVTLRKGESIDVMQQ